ncbi:unnamed protein product [Prorocentrum cordatum]|uniref:Uncharacterized protein n=1 Tax=Prorocentrum cordatum TaxID=2364126 RepID=A0ABN9RW76_9DINO|nr:unnamed protein product [Polarella glacialis]
MSTLSGAPPAQRARVPWMHSKPSANQRKQYKREFQQEQRMINREAFVNARETKEKLWAEASAAAWPPARESSCQEAQPRKRPPQVGMMASPSAASKTKNHVAKWKYGHCGFVSFGFRGYCMRCAGLPPTGIQQQQAELRQEVTCSEQPNQHQQDDDQVKENIQVDWDPYLIEEEMLEEALAPARKRNRWSSRLAANKEAIVEALLAEVDAEIRR